MDTRCQGCRYNTPKTQGGQGKICNGYTMTEHSRCPEWVINEYLREVNPRTLVMSEVIQHNRVRKEVTPQ